MKSKQVQFLVGALFSLSLSVATVAAQEQAPAPSLKDGDTWQFNFTNKGQVVTSSAYIVGIFELVFSQGQLKVYEVNGNQKTEMDIKSEGPGSGMPSLVGIINEQRPTLKFPLSVGQKWTYEYVSWSVPYRANLKYSVEVTVTGMEQVTTPAGSFKAYKLVRNQQWQSPFQGAKWFTATTAYFYSPDTGSVVKSTLTTDAAAQLTQAIELIKFTPGK
jgi:hypothetical protein